MKYQLQQGEAATAPLKGAEAEAGARMGGTVADILKTYGMITVPAFRHLEGQ